MVNKDAKYQGVKEFHMLVRIGCYCKVMDLNLVKDLKILLKLQIPYYCARGNQW